MCVNFNDFLTDDQLHWLGLDWIGLDYDWDKKQDNSHILMAATTPSSTGHTLRP